MIEIECWLPIPISHFARFSILPNGENHQLFVAKIFTGRSIDVFGCKTLQCFLVTRFC